MFTSSIKLSSGWGRAVDPRPTLLPHDSGAAALLARDADRAADEALAEGRFGEADRLGHLAVELRARARATGARA